MMTVQNIYTVPEERLQDRRGKSLLSSKNFFLKHHRSGRGAAGLSSQVLLLVMLAALAVGCKTQKNSVKAPVGEAEASYLSSKLELTIPHGESIYTINGTMKLRKDSIVQVSMLMPILRTEVARVEVTPEQVLIVDRMNRRYCRTTRDELGRQLPKNWTYNRVEQLLYKASQPDGKKSLTGEELGIDKLRKAKVELYDFSDEKVNVSPTNLSSRYTEVTLNELLQFLASL